jgi:TatD DNase family protein
MPTAMRWWRARGRAAYGCAYALGIHPLWLADAQPADIDRLREMVAAALADPRFVAIGEIGLDFAEPGLDPERQQWFYREQLKVARDFGLPVIVHIRRSADLLLKHLRAIDVPGGIIHAFNASAQQAQQFVGRGFRLGFGGAMTYRGSERIRRHACTVPDDAWVLETDAPYIPPQWLRGEGDPARNEPSHLPRIAAELATLRGTSVATLAAQNRANAVAALPRLGAWLAASNV